MASTVVKGAAVAKEAAAYVTFLAGSGDYWKGVVGLAKGLPRRQVGLPAGGRRAPRRPRGSPPHAGRPGLRRPRDRARVSAGKPEPVRHGLLRHQLLQAPYLGGESDLLIAPNILC